MFDPSQKLHDYFVQQGHCDLEAHKLAAEVSGRCPQVWLVPTNKPERAPVSSAEKHTMPEETNNVPQDSEIIDLGFEISEADVARPVIRAGTYNATIAFVRQEPSRQKGLPQLLVGYRLMEAVKDMFGKEIGLGFTVTQRILMKPTGGLTQTMINDRIGRIHFAACGPGHVTTAAWVGKPVMVRLSVRESHRDKETGEEYDATNDVARVFPAPKSAIAAEA